MNEWVECETASFVAKTILDMEQAGDLTVDSTVAIIYRTNAQSRALEEACVAQNVRYLVRGSAGTFYSRAEVKDCLCFLKWLYNGRDRSALLRAIKTPSRGIGEVSLNEFASYCENVEKFVDEQRPGVPIPTPLETLMSLSSLERIGNSNNFHLPPNDFMSKRTINRLLPFANQMNSIHQKAQIQTVSELLTSIISTLDLKSHFDSISKTNDEFADRWGNVMELINAAERYNEDGPCLSSTKMDENNEGFEEIVGADCPLGKFLDDVSLLTDIDVEGSAESSSKRLVANLMTIHASKGMEFDAVFLVGNEEGSFPTQRSIMEGEGSIELEEERRLCYVAMTRAKTHLILTWRREVMTFFGQGFKFSNPDRSRFLDALVSKKKRVSTQKASKKSHIPPSKLKQTPSAFINSQRQLNSRPSVSRQSHPISSNEKTYQQFDNQRSRFNTKMNRPSSNNYTSRNSQYKSTPTTKRKTLEKSSEHFFDQDDEFKSGRNKSMDYNGYRKPRSVSSQEGIPARRGTRSSTHTRMTMNSRDGSINQRSKSYGVPDNMRLKTTLQQSAPKDVPSIDSTAFYPVGTTVIHPAHGKGTVITPTGGDSKVSVQFDEGIQLNLPMTNSGLTIKY